jgi:trans-aconitate methyltransferase
MNLNDVKNDPVHYIDHYDLDGVEYGRSTFNLEWITAVTETPKTIFDVGCYDCGDSIRFKQRFPECDVYSFEASPQRHPKLRLTA